jgi:hypothetical protein
VPVKKVVKKVLRPRATFRARSIFFDDNARWTLSHTIGQSYSPLSKLHLDLVAHLIGRWRSVLMPTAS